MSVHVSLDLGYNYGATPKAFTRALHVAKRHPHDKDRHAVPWSATALTPASVRVTWNANALDADRAVWAVTIPFASMIAPQADRQLNDSWLQWHPVSQRAAHPCGVLVMVMLKGAGVTVAADA